MTMVRLGVTFEMEKEVPYRWDSKMINFYFNESGWCQDNLVHHLSDMVEDEATEKRGKCLCGMFQIEHIPDSVEVTSHDRQ